MKKSLLITFFLILIPSISVQGQETDSLSSHSKLNYFIDFRAFIATFQGSLNLEVEVYEGKNALLLNQGIGFTSIFWEGETGTGFSFPTTFSVLLGSLPYDQRTKHLEINAGTVNLIDDVTQDILPFPRASIGYRYQNPESGKIFRIYAGFLSIGMSFNL